MLKRVLKMNPAVARNAELQEKTASDRTEKCTLQFVQNAAKKLRFPLSPKKTALYTAANASLNTKENSLATTAMF